MILWPESELNQGQVAGQCCGFTWGTEALCLVFGAFPWWSRRGRCLFVIEGYCWMISDPCLHTFQTKLVCFVRMDFILRCCYGGYCKYSNSICEVSPETLLFPAACLYWLEEILLETCLIPCFFPPLWTWFDFYKGNFASLKLQRDFDF